IMNDRRQKLMDQVSGLPDKELLHILDEASSDYRFDTIVYAKAEADKRGLSYSQPDMARLNTHSTRNSKRDLFEISRSHTFGIGFLGTLSFFILVNYLNYTHVSSGLCDDCFQNYGFPYTYYQAGGYAGGFGFSLSGLALDVAISLGLSLAIGWLCRKIFDLKKQST